MEIPKLKSLFQHPIVVNFPLFSSLFVLRRIDPRLEIWNGLNTLSLSLSLCFSLCFDTRDTAAFLSIIFVEKKYQMLKLIFALRFLRSTVCEYCILSTNKTFKKNCFLLPLGLVWCDFLAPHLSAYQTCVSMENEKLRTWSQKTRNTTLYKNCWVGLTIEFFFFRCAHCTRLGYSKQKVCLKGERAALEGVCDKQYNTSDFYFSQSTH